MVCDGGSFPRRHAENFAFGQPGFQFLARLHLCRVAQNLSGGGVGGDGIAAGQNLLRAERVQALFQLAQRFAPQLQPAATAWTRKNPPGRFCNTSPRARAACLKPRNKPDCKSSSR